MDGRVGGSSTLLGFGPTSKPAAATSVRITFGLPRQPESGDDSVRVRSPRDPSSSIAEFQRRSSLYSLPPSISNYESLNVRGTERRERLSITIPPYCNPLPPESIFRGTPAMSASRGARSVSANVSVWTFQAGGPPFSHGVPRLSSYGHCIGSNAMLLCNVQRTDEDQGGPGSSETWTRKHRKCCRGRWTS